MPITDARGTLKKLVVLQETDREILAVEAALEKGPDLLQQRGKRLRELEARFEEHRASSRKRKVHANQVEMDVREKDSALRKLSAQLNTARSNQEYRALRDQITRLEGERSQAEDLGLRVLEEVARDEELEKQLHAELDAARAEFHAFERQLETDLAAYRSDLESLKKRRAELSNEIERDAVMAYERIRAARDGVAVAVVEGGVCQGCYMSVTTNDILQVRAGQALTACKSCQRILYLPDTMK
ncbi:MAG: C4-type zinc ribbon domain-containing protein [Planctomycetota bacterium]